MSSLIKKLLGTLALIAVINWFVFFGIDMYLGGSAIGTLPSQQGYILTDHGHRTTVSESTWVFSLYYTAATLLLTPTILLLSAALYYWPRRREGIWYKKLGIGVFLTVWCILWYEGNGSGFLTSLSDWKHLKAQPGSAHLNNDSLPTKK